MKKILLSSFFLFPLVTNAQTFNDLIKGFLGYVNQAIPILIALILLAFFWSVADFIRISGKGGEVEEAKKRLWWGIIALFIGVSFWGIVQFLTSDFFNETPSFGAPGIQTDRVNDPFPGTPARNDSQTGDIINTN